jgi:serine protease AprX
MKNKFLFFVIFSCYFNLMAQQDAWVYLTDKQDVTNSIANPLTILSQKAIDRKNAHGVVIDDRDVPVNESYITQLKLATGIAVKAKSKWFNAVHVRGTESDINNLLTTLPYQNFIDHIDFADKSLNINKKVKQKNESKLETLLTTFNYGSAANQIEMFNGDALHVDGFTGTGMTVAVLDAGFPNVHTMSSFQRLRDAGNIKDDYDFVNRDDDVYTNTISNHGTLVLSTMAGYIENQYVGTAPDASYYLFITEDDSDENPVEESYWVEAAERADSLGVDVINTSLGYKDYGPNYTSYSYTSADLNGDTAFITKGANIAFEKGMLLVNSAGNSGNGGINAPADAAGVFTIGAVNASGSYASFSSVGSAFQPTQKPDVVAQGQASVVITENDIIGTVNGTSFSSPIMAGGLVCLWQALPNKTNAEIMQLVRESASQYTTPDYFLGFGIPNLYQVYNTTLSIENTNFSKDLKIFPNPVMDTIFFTLPENESKISIVIYDILGKHLSDNIITKTNNEIDVSSFSKGIYLVKMLSGKQSKTIKFIKN